MNAAGDSLTLGFRPHALGEREGGPIKGRVVLVERLGNETNVSVQLPSGTAALAVLDGDRALSIGAEIAFDLAPEAAILFDAKGDALHP